MCGRHSDREDQAVFVDNILNIIDGNPESNEKIITESLEDIIKLPKINDFEFITLFTVAIFRVVSANFKDHPWLADQMSTFLQFWSNNVLINNGAIEDGNSD